MYSLNRYFFLFFSHAIISIVNFVTHCFLCSWHLGCFESEIIWVRANWNVSPLMISKQSKGHKFVDPPFIPWFCVPSFVWSTGAEVPCALGLTQQWLYSFCIVDWSLEMPHERRCCSRSTVLGWPCIYFEFDSPSWVQLTTCISQGSLE